MKKSEEAELINLCQKIVDNVENRGLYRYDRADVKWLPTVNKKGYFYRILRIFILVLDSFFPITLRKVLHIKKTIPPTTYTYLGNAYLFAEEFEYRLIKKQSACGIVELCLNHYFVYENGNAWWNPSLPKPLLPILDKQNDKRPTMNMHSMARCNILLLNLYAKYRNEKYLNIAYDSLVTTLCNHVITFFEAGCVSVNYYYNTDDCTINVNSEFAQWISMLPLEKKTEKLSNILNGILKLILKEQLPDGSWTYYSLDYHKRYNLPLSIDCHHTGTILNNMLQVIKSEWISGPLREELIEAIDRGMRFYINNFFDVDTGKGKTYIGSSRPAGPVQYSEAICAFCEYLDTKFPINNQLKIDICKILPKVVNCIISFVNLKDGSSPSEKVIKWVYLDSIRWGNGPILEALLRYLSIQNKLIND